MSTETQEAAFEGGELILRSLHELFGYAIDGRDAYALGKAKDFLFDERTWTIRYLVADTGSWLSSHKVLISPQHLMLPEVGVFPSVLPVNLTKDEVEACPLLSEDAPVSRRYELAYARYHGQYPYWAGPDLWGPAAFPIAPPPQPTAEELERHERELEQIEDCHLRSAKEVMGYHIGAVDGSVGHVEDLIMDAQTWTIHWMIVDTRNWLPGRKVLIAPRWVRSFDWEVRKARVDLTVQQIKESPPFDPHEPINRGYGEQLYDYYGMVIEP